MYRNIFIGTASLLILSLTSCSNRFKTYYTANRELKDYNPEVLANIKPDLSDPQVIYTENLELEAVVMIENGYLNMGYSYFQSGHVNDEKQAYEFAKELGATAVVIKRDRETPSSEGSSSSAVEGYVVSPVYGDHTVNGFPTYNQPSFSYNFSYDTDSQTLNEDVQTSNAYGTTQTHVRDGEVVAQMQVPTHIAQQMWATPYSDRSYYAVPNGSTAFIMPIHSSTPSNVFSYYATFWAKSGYPPAFGVNVTRIPDKVKKDLELSAGVSVWAVHKDSPASRVPIYRGDILTAIDGKPIAGSLEMGRLIRSHVGKKVRIDMVRDGKPLTREVHLKERSF